MNGWVPNSGRCFTCGRGTQEMSDFYCRTCVEAQMRAQGKSDWELFDEYQRWAHGLTADDVEVCGLCGVRRPAPGLTACSTCA